MRRGGHGCAGTVADVRRRARDGAGRGNAAQEGCENVGDTLPDQLLVWIVPRLRHTIGYGGREEGFNCPERGDCERRAHQSADEVECRHWEIQSRQAGRNPAVTAGNCRDRQVRQMRNGCRNSHGNDAGGNPAIDSRPEINNRHGQGAERHAPSIHPTEMLEEHRDLLRCVLGHFQAEPEKFIELSAKNNDGDAAGESGDDGVREKF